VTIVAAIVEEKRIVGIGRKTILRVLRLYRSGFLAVACEARAAVAAEGFGFKQLLPGLLIVSWVLAAALAGSLARQCSG